MKYYNFNFADYDKMREVLDKSPFVFVYGTLKRGHGNNRLLKTSEFISEDTTADKFYMAAQGCPFVYPENVVKEVLEEPNHLLYPVFGEVYRVNSAVTMSELDTLESEGWMYHRELIETTSGVTAWMYVCKNSAWLPQDKPCTLEEGAWKWK